MPEPPQDTAKWLGSARSRHAGAFLLVLGVALLLRCGNLTRESAWYDEILTLPYLGADSFAEYWRGLCAADTVPRLTPVHPVLAYGWAQIFGPGLLASRTFSLFCGTISIMLIERVGTVLFNRRTGLLAASMLAFSLPHIYYSQEVRRYAFEEMLVLASFLALCHAARGSLPAWCAHICSLVLLPFTSIFTVALYPAFALTIWYAPALPRRRRVVWFGFALASLLLYGVYYRGIDTGGMAWQAPPTWRELLNAFVVFAGGRYSNMSPAEYLPLGVNLDLLLAVLLYGLAIIAMLHQRMGVSRWGRQGVLMLWLFLPPLLWFIFAVFFTPSFMHRYLIFCAFPLYIAAAAGVSGLRGPFARRALIAAIGALLFFQSLVILRGPFRPDYRACGEMLLRNESPIVILKPKLNQGPLQYAAPIPPARIVTANGEDDLKLQARSLASLESGGWIVMWRWDRVAEFEEYLKHTGIDSRRHRLGGMPPLILIELSR